MTWAAPKLIRCTSEPPWSCTFLCRACGAEAVVTGRWGASNHHAIRRVAADHRCPED